MGFFDSLKQKKEESDKEKKEEEVPEGKYSETCALCGNAGTEKKWMGQYWHKKCLRKGKKAARGMI